MIGLATAIGLDHASTALLNVLTTFASPWTVNGSDVHPRPNLAPHRTTLGLSDAFEDAAVALRVLNVENLVGTSALNHRALNDRGQGTASTRTRPARPAPPEGEAFEGT